MRALLVVLALVACGASAREKTIAATLSATDTASAAFVKYDAAHQASLVTAAKDPAGGHAALEAWRINQLEVERYLAATYQTIAAAAVATTDPNYNAMVQAALLLSQALHTLGVAP